MKSKLLSQILLLGIIFLVLPIGVNINVNAECENIVPFFSISLLAPTYMAGPNPWALEMQEQLPKIGIGVNLVDVTSWTEIYSRSWAYPGTLPVPTYAEGGFDILFQGWSSSLDWNPKGLYDSDSIIPSGNNVYQYSSQEMDWAISNYSSSLTAEDRNYWGAEVQSILYGDLPEISMVYPKNLVVMDDQFTSWDGVLWENDHHTMENWSIPGQTEFRYAIPSEIDDFYIYTCNSLFDEQWLNQIYTGLVTRSTDPNDNHQYIPNLATTIESTDGMNYTITLNPNVKFADGVKLNATDIEYSYTIIMDPEFDNPSESIWAKNLEVQSITILDEFELKISFKEPYVFQDRNLALPILPKHIWLNVTAEYQKSQAANWASLTPNKLVGTGPYYLEEYNTTYDFIHLKRNNYYDDWSGITPYFEDIYFEFYTNKESALSDLENENLDMICSHFTIQLDEIPETNCKYELVKDPSVQEMVINMNNPYFGTGELCPIASAESARHIRRAISYMVPREDLVNEVLFGLGEPGVTGCPSAATVFDESLLPMEYSLELALAEMEATGIYFSYASSASIDLPYILSILGLVGCCSILFKKIKR
ncbi:MAG TPA: ABC transporter substrate-binding protein [Candidatus Bathyarchaeia archaeon]|nr:ABC transporter substrate-binding protein [Candidatus Bathyarchaeia archaeon]